MDDTVTDQTINSDDFHHTHCPSAMVITGYDIETELMHFFQTTCNRWNCINCGPWKTWDFCNRVEAAEPNRFITLTCTQPAGQTPRDVWKRVRRQVPELIRWIRKHRGPCEYARVLEEHKSGFPHFHLIVRGPYIQQSVLSDQWFKLTDAFMVDIRKINPGGGVARYVAKYLSKQMGHGFTERRVTNSKHFFPPKPEKEASNLQLEGVQRYKGSLARIWAWEFPWTELEVVGPNHWISVLDNTATRGDRYKLNDGRVPHQFEQAQLAVAARKLGIDTNHPTTKTKEVRATALGYSTR